MTTPALEDAAKVIEKLESDGHRFLDDLSGHNESVLISYIAQAIRQAEEQVVLRMRSAELSPEELRMAEKHCEWPSFRCAFRAVMKSRALKSEQGA